MSNRYNSSNILWTPPPGRPSASRILIVNEAQTARPDLISFEAYQTPDLWWYVLWYNDIVDPLSLTAGRKLFLPGRSLVNLQLQGWRIDTSQSATLQTQAVAGVGPTRMVTGFGSSIQGSRRPLTIKPAPTRRYVNPAFDPSEAGQEQELAPLVSGPLNFGFSAPIDLAGDSLHFQVQASASLDFESIVFSSLTFASANKWYWYNPAASNGAGGVVVFPPAGINPAMGGNTVYRVIDELSPATWWLRWRWWLDGVESEWVATPPITL